MMSINPFAVAALSFFFASHLAALVQLVFRLGDDPAVLFAIIDLVSCSGCLFLAVVIEVATTYDGLGKWVFTPPENTEKPVVLVVPQKGDRGDVGIITLLWTTERLAAGLAGVSAMIVYARCGALLDGIGVFVTLSVQLLVVLPRTCFALRKYLDKLWKKLQDPAKESA